jgi:hypothetical protein
MAIYGKHEDKNKWYSPQEIRSQSERNTIQLLAKDAVGIGGAKHYYFVYTNNQGKQTYLSAYPEKPFPPFGKIVMKTGEYKPNTPDFKDSIKVMTFRSTIDNPIDVASSFVLLRGQFRRIQAANISYGGLTNNSNSAALTALHNITLTANVSYENNAGPTGVFAPGNNDYLMPAEYSKVNKANGKESTTLQQTDNREISFVPQTVPAQSSTGNVDLDRALAMLDQMNNKEANSINSPSEVEKTIVASRSRGREIGG